MEYKWIKDNIHGYIKIEKDFLKIGIPRRLLKIRLSETDWRSLQMEEI